jgi:hypothetical protein
MDTERKSAIWNAALETIDRVDETLAAGDRSNRDGEPDALDQWRAAMPPQEAEPMMVKTYRPSPAPPARRDPNAVTPKHFDNLIVAMRTALNRERAEMRKHVEAELKALKDEIAQLKAELAVRRELDEIRQQMAVLRGGGLIDVSPPRRAATGPRSA